MDDASILSRSWLIVLTALLFESCDCFITEVIKTQRGRLRSVLQRSTSDEKYYTVDEVAEAKFGKSRNSANRGDNGKSSARAAGTKVLIQPRVSNLGQGQIFEWEPWQG